MFDLTPELCREYMAKCIELAKLSSPEIKKPYVGTIVLSETGETIGEGYKTYLPSTTLTMHAERKALDTLTNKKQNGTLITTLEPCIHVNKRQLFSSCADLIIENRIARVVIGMIDTSPSVHGGAGANYLTDNGIDVIYWGEFRPIIKRELMPRFQKQQD